MSVCYSLFSGVLLRSKTGPVIVKIFTKSPDQYFDDVVFVLKIQLKTSNVMLLPVIRRP